MMMKGITLHVWYSQGYNCTHFVMFCFVLGRPDIAAYLWRVAVFCRSHRYESCRYVIVRKLWMVLEWPIQVKNSMVNSSRGNNTLELWPYDEVHTLWASPNMAKRCIFWSFFSRVHFYSNLIMQMEIGCRALGGGHILQHDYWYNMIDEGSPI